MFKFKKITRYSKKDGYILVYVLVLGTFLISMSLYMFSLNLNEYEYIKTNESIIVNNQFEDYRQVLFTKLNTFIKNNMSAPTKESIKLYLSEIPNGKIVSYGEGKIEYSEDDLLYLIVPYNEYKKRIDIYDYKFENNKFILSYCETKYEVR